MPAERLVLKCIAGPETGLSLALSGHEISIGRGSENTLRLPKDSTVSTHHARLYLRADGWHLRDLGSKNGTWIVPEGAERVRVTADVLLRVGQPFYVGSSGFLIDAGPQATIPKAVKVPAPELLRLELHGGKLRCHLTSQRPTAPVYESSCSDADMQVWTRKFGDHALLSLQGADHFATIASLMGEFARNHLAEKLLARLAENEDPLLIMHEPALLGIPWEALPLTNAPLGLARPVSRQLLLENQSLRASKPPTGGGRCLFLVNPTSDRPELEGQAQEIFTQVRKRVPLAQHVYLSRERVTRAEALRRLADADLVYYAGHASYDPARPDLSGWILADGVLPASALANLASVPSLVIANGCESARGSGGARIDSEEVSSLMSAFLLGGVSHYLGTLWPVSAAAGAAFGSVFVDELLDGRLIAAAMQEAREAARIASPHTACWAAYALLGNPTTTLSPPM